MLWLEKTCPECTNQNWFHLGDFSDIEDFHEIEEFGGECYDCQTIFYLAQNNEEIVEDNIDIFTIEGQPSPL